MSNFNWKMSCVDRATLFLVTVFLCSAHSSVSALEFQVGGDKDWVVPPANDSKIYNVWASENRFQVGDTIRFKYKKDSVMEVAEAEYKKCNSTRPNYFSNTGNSVYRFDHSGSFYFISGAAGHCERGQRMIVRVMAAAGEEDDSPSTTGGSTPSSASPAPVVGASKLVLAQLVISYVAWLLF